MDKATFAVKKALLIFARRPIPGKVKTRLSPPLSPREATDLYQCMLEDVLENTSVLCNVDRLLFFDPGDDAEVFFQERYPGPRLFPQQGDGLGERLEHAFGVAFAMGYDAVAVIGTDSPDLPSGHVRDAFRCLEEEKADVVFGPATDGGYYLVASRKPHCGLFRGIPWSTGEVLVKSERNADSLGLTTVRLEVWHDLDTVDDLRRLFLGGNPDGAERTLRFLRENADRIGFRSF